jgi:hypothetical protein
MVNEIKAIDKEMTHNLNFGKYRILKTFKREEAIKALHIIKK